VTVALPHHRFSTVPAAQGLFNPANEKDSCGFAMVATLRQQPGHDIIDVALGSLRNLEHRGAVGSDAGTGDGAGILTQIPHAFFDAITAFDLPENGFYAAGNAFLPQDLGRRDEIKSHLAQTALDEGLRVLGWRTVPVDPTHLGTLAREAMPAIEQVFISSATGELSGLELDRAIFRLRKRVERDREIYFPSLSSRTIVYKGMLTTLQLEPFYPDLSDERFASTIALVHSRYSTNTFPSWPLAHPFRFIALSLIHI
jgi:glutamate synthase (NADPH/NADH) large chain